MSVSSKSLETRIAEAILDPQLRETINEALSALPSGSSVIAQRDAIERVLEEAATAEKRT